MKNDLETRTKRFALSIIELVGKLPQCKASDVIGYQLLKSGTSIGANYREATRAQSCDDFIHKIGICEKETSETEYWLELAQGADLIALTASEEPLRETQELLAIFVASGRTAKSRRCPPNPQSAFRLFCSVRCKIPPRTIEARKPPFPLRAASAPGPNTRSIQ